MLAKLRSFIRDEEGVTMVEYALILALVAVVAIVAWQTLGSKINNAVKSANDAIPNSSPSGGG